MLIPVTARLDCQGRTLSRKDLRGNIITVPLWYQVTMCVDPNTSVESFIQKVKNEVLTQITKLKSENSNISLTMDKILFDNIILLDQVFKNLEILDKF